MPRVHFVKQARKDVKGSDIKKGESYYWWKFRYGGKNVSRTQPKPQQLTQSEYQSSIYDFQDVIASMAADESIADELQQLIDDMTELRDEQEEKKSNMPDSLQESPTGELLQERYDELDGYISELEGVDTDVDEDLNDEEKEERYNEILEEIRNCGI